MNTLIGKLKSVSKVQWLALALIVIGLAIMVPKALGMWQFTKEVQYATRNHFQDGNPSLDLIRPWMPLRYIAAAYGVPQKILFDALNVQPRPDTSVISISRLNRQMNLGQVDGQPALMKPIREAIQAYRANPVAPGLLERKVDGWMTVQYIANSTGIPSETIFAAIGIPEEGNLFDALGYLSDKVNYPGGAKALQEAIQKVVDEKGAKKP